MKKSSVKKVLALALSLCLAFTAFGCSNGSQSSSAPASSGNSASSTASSSEGAKTEEKTAKLVVTRWVTTDDGSAVRELVDAFVAENPNVEIELQQPAWNNYFDQLNVNIAGGNMPDVIGMSTGQGSKYYNDAFENLT